LLVMSSPFAARAEEVAQPVAKHDIATSMR
jgi:hypothetical protein